MADILDQLNSDDRTAGLNINDSEAKITTDVDVSSTTMTNNRNKEMH